MDTLREKYNNWLELEYDKYVKEESKNVWINDLMNTLDYGNSYLNIVNVIKDVLGMKDEYLYQYKNFTCITCNITKDDSAIYAHIYGNIEIRDDREYRFYPIYYVLSPSFSSMDGEYRHRLINARVYNDIKEENKDLICYLKEFMKEKVKLQDLKISNSVFNSFGEYGKFISINPECNYELLGIVWLLEIIPKLLNIYPPHSNLIFKNIMYTKYDMNQFSKLAERLSLKYLKTFRKLYSRQKWNYKTDKSFYRSVEIGVKIVPLTIQNTKHIMDPCFNLWREIIISRLVSDLKVNFICQGLSLFSGLMLITNSDAELYDNIHIIRKYKHSKEVLKEIQKLTKNYHKHISVGHTSTYKQRKTSLTDKIDISNQSLVMVGEYVGRTFENLFSLVKAKEYLEKIGNVFEQYQTFHKYIFEFVYNIFCINSVCGVIHGDTHLNNVTVHALSKEFYHEDVLKFKIKNDGIKNDGIKTDKTDKDHGIKNKPHLKKKTDRVGILYNVSGQYFLFENNGLHTHLIDYSRSFVLPQKIKKHIQDEDIRKSFIEMQDNELISKYCYLIKTNVYKNKLKNALKDNRSDMFKLLSAMDIYEFTSKLYSMIKFTKIKCLGVNLCMLTKIRDNSKKFLMKDMWDYVKLIEAGSDKIINYSGKCLNTFFDDFIINDYTGKLREYKGANWVLSNIVRYRPTMKYSMKEYKDLPDIVTQYKILENGKIKNHPLNKFNNDLFMERYSLFSENKKNMDYVIAKAKPIVI